MVSSTTGWSSRWGLQLRLLWASLAGLSPIINEQSRYDYRAFFILKVVPFT